MKRDTLERLASSLDRLTHIVLEALDENAGRVASSLSKGGPVPNLDDLHLSARTSGALKRAALDTKYLIEDVRNNR